jgi:hypothetical protein
VTTVDATSTVWVNSAGSVVPAPSSNSGKTLALGLGVGIGVPVAIAVAALGLWMCIRQHRSLPGATSELGGQSVRRELGGTGLYPFPNISPSLPVLVPGRHEMHGADGHSELLGQPKSPPPLYYPLADNAERDQWELP